MQVLDTRAVKAIARDALEALVESEGLETTFRNLWNYADADFRRYGEGWSRWHWRMAWREVADELGRSR